MKCIADPRNGTATEYGSSLLNNLPTSVLPGISLTYFIKDDTTEADLEYHSPKSPFSQVDVSEIHLMIPPNVDPDPTQGSIIPPNFAENSVKYSFTVLSPK